MSIKVDYARMEHAHQQMLKISNEIDSKLDTLRARLQRMQWEGEDARAYQEHQARWDAAIRDINQLLKDISAAVGIARENYMTTEASNARVWQ